MRTSKCQAAPCCRSAADVAHLAAANQCSQSEHTLACREYHGHAKGVLGMSWCPQDASFLLSSAKDNRTICWDVSSGVFGVWLCFMLLQCILPALIRQGQLHHLLGRRQVRRAVFSVCLDQLERHQCSLPAAAAPALETAPARRVLSMQPRQSLTKPTSASKQARCTVSCRPVPTGTLMCSGRPARCVAVQRAAVGSGWVRCTCMCSGPPARCTAELASAS